MALEHAPHASEAPTPQTSSRPSRSWGVDLGRALAAVAVVIIHASASGDAPVRPGAATLREVVSFAVPFFLATSAVFAVRSITASRSAWAVSRQRLARLLLPYVTWTLIYLALKAASSRLAGDPARIDRITGDPGRLVFLGGASVQLYFLPMLAVGMVMLPLVDVLVRRLRYRTDAIGLAALTVVPYWLAGLTGNGYDIATATGFRSLVDPHRTRALDAIVRIALVAVVWAARFLPYLGLAVLVRVYRLDRRCPPWLLAVGAGLLLLVEIGFRPFQPHILRELAVSFPLLLVCFALPAPSAQRRAARAVSSVAKHSFGIFLAHTAILQVVQDVADRVHPGALDTITPLAVVATAVPTFLLAWAAAIVIDRVAPLRRFLVAG